MDVRDKPKVDNTRRKALMITSSLMGAVTVAGFAVPFLSAWNPSEKAKALGASVKFDLSNANKVSVDVYVPSSSITGSQDNKLWIKLQDGSKDRPWEGQVTKEKAIELDKWQYLEFDFSDQKDQTAFSRLLLQFNGENNNDQVTAYIDNLFIHR